MPTALTKTDITTVSIGTTRGSAANAWEYVFKTTDDAITFGNIFDNGDTFSDGSTSTAKALKIEISGDAETVAIQDMDTLVVDGLTIWLPALTSDDILYVDTDGNTWFDESLTIPAGGVSALSDTVSMSEEDYDATAFLTDSITLSETFTEESTDYLYDYVYVSESLGNTSVESFEIYLSDTIRVDESITSSSTEDMTIYLSDTIMLSESFTGSSYGDFTEDTQNDYTWTEI